MDAEIDDVKVFNMSTYSSRKRSQQLCAKGLVDCSVRIILFAQLGTGLRFKPLMVQAAFEKVLESPRKLNHTKFSKNQFAR